MKIKSSNGGVVDFEEKDRELENFKEIKITFAEIMQMKILDLMQVKLNKQEEKEYMTDDEEDENGSEKLCRYIFVTLKSRIWLTRSLMYGYANDIQCLVQGASSASIYKHFVPKLQ